MKSHPSFLLCRALLPVLTGLALMGCASKQAATTTAAAAHQPSNRHEAEAAQPAAASASAPKRAAPAEVRTRNAVFKLASFDELPGWQQDDMRASWSAFRNSCEVLQKRDDWRSICNGAKGVAPNSRDMRSFFESRFTLLRILNTDTSREGDVTGYFEPLLEGQPFRDAEFNVPVMGVPRDLYSIDWTRIPKAQRNGVVRVKPDISTRTLSLLVDDGNAGYALDLQHFELDDRDRRLRVRLVGDGANAMAEPYYTRAELESRGLPGGIDAPVLIWVNDPLALYAMQVQGSGRVRQPDGSILRLQYAEQNGHPFKPLRVVPKAPARVVTRGANATPYVEPAAQFLFEDDAGMDDAPVLTRGGSVVPAAPKRTGTASDDLVDQLLKDARKPAAPAAKPMPRQRVASRLGADPSYVFFKVVAERPQTEGPQGALGVALTPGRSVAVDPRVTPLGYPVFLSAPAPAGSSISMQRLVFAQDTGGAIRGAVRADYFWGFGSEAGQMARSTKHRGQMWVLLPNDEASKLASSRLLTRGGASWDSDVRERCLIDDGEFCSDAP